MARDCGIISLNNMSNIDFDVFVAGNTAAFVSICSLIALPSLFLCVVCIVALLLAHTLNWPLRVALILIFVVESCYWLAFCIVFYGYTVRIRNPSGEVFSCKLYLSLFIFTSLMKLTAIALYAVVVYVFIRHGVNKQMLVTMLSCIAVLTVVFLAVSSMTYFPPFQVSIDLGFCSYHVNTFYYVILFTVIIIMAVLLCIIITFSILACCYIKRNTLEDNVEVKHAVAKNLFFLLLSAIFYFIYILTPPWYPFIREGLANNPVLCYFIINYVFRISLNLIPVGTPIVAIAVLKPIRFAIKNILKRIFPNLWQE